MKWLAKQLQALTTHEQRRLIGALVTGILIPILVAVVFVGALMLVNVL